VLEIASSKYVSKLISSPISSLYPILDIFTGALMSFKESLRRIISSKFKIADEDWDYEDEYGEDQELMRLLEEAYR